MAKYNELIKEFSTEIESIKCLNVKEAEINVRLTEAYEASIGDGDGDDVKYFFSCKAIEDEMGQVIEVLHSEMSGLSHEVEMAYWEVPFAKPRNQGIAKFWELSGLE